MWVGITQSIEDSNGTKKLEERQTHFLSWDVHLSFPWTSELLVLRPSDSRIDTSRLLVLKPLSSG